MVVGLFESVPFDERQDEVDIDLHLFDEFNFEDKVIVDVDRISFGLRTIFVTQVEIEGLIVLIIGDGDEGRLIVFELIKG